MYEMVERIHLILVSYSSELNDLAALSDFVQIEMLERPSSYQIPRKIVLAQAAQGRRNSRDA